MTTTNSQLLVLAVGLAAATLVLFLTVIAIGGALMLLGNILRLSKHMLQEVSKASFGIELYALSNKNKFCFQELEKKEKRYIFPLYDAMAC
jgi:hypothetical protein